MGRATFLYRHLWGILNLLPDVVMKADIIKAFNISLDRHMDIQGMEGYGSQAGRRDEFILTSCLARASTKGLVLCSTLFKSLMTFQDIS